MGWCHTFLHGTTISSQKDMPMQKHAQREMKTPTKAVVKQWEFVPPKGMLNQE